MPELWRISLGVSTLSGPSSCVKTIKTRHVLEHAEFDYQGLFLKKPLENLCQDSEAYMKTSPEWRSLGRGAATEQK